MHFFCIFLCTFTHNSIPYINIYIYIYTHKNLIYQSSNGSTECKSERRGMGVAAPTKNLIVIFLRFVFVCSFEVSNDLMQFAQCCSHRCVGTRSQCLDTDR